MSQGFYTWSTTAATNATADSSINWAEGQAPSTINDSARATMARVREFGNDISGSIVTGGTSTAYTVSSNQNFDSLAHLAGQMIAFTPNATNAAGPITLNVDGLGAKPLRLSPGVEIQSGVLIQGTPYCASYNNTDGAFYLFGMGSNAYAIPLAAGIDYWGTTTPSSAFAFPVGQQISQTTYSSLYTLFGPNRFGSDGGGLFYLPDLRGRVSVPADNMGGSQAGRVSAILANAIGSAGGNATSNLAQNQLPNVAPTFVGTNPAVSFIQTVTTNTVPSGAASSFGYVASASLASLPTPGGTVGSINGGVTQQAINLLQPSIVCNYIIRII